MYKFSASAFMHAEVRAAPRRIHEFFKDLCWNLSSFSRTWKSFHRARTSKDDTEDYAHARKYVTGSTCTSPLRECFFGCASKLITIPIHYRFFLYFFFALRQPEGSGTFDEPKSLTRLRDYLAMHSMRPLRSYKVNVTLVFYFCI